MPSITPMPRDDLPPRHLNYTIVLVSPGATIVTDFVDVIIRSVQEQSTARVKTQKWILSELKKVKETLSQINGALPELQERAIRDEMAKVEELFRRLTSRNPFKHGQWRPFWNSSIFGKGSKLRRTLSSMQQMADNLGMVGDGHNFNVLYHEFEWLKRIVTHDIPQMRAELKKERDVLFTEDKIFDQEHYLRFLQHCDHIETHIGLKSVFVERSGSALQLHLDTIKEEALFEVRNHYVDLLLHYLFKSYNPDNANNFIFYQAQELMRLLSSKEGAILDANFLNNWRTICETNQKRSEQEGVVSRELHGEILKAEELSKQNKQAMEDFLLAFYRCRNPGDQESDAIANLNLKVQDESSPKTELFNEILTNNRALKDLFCYRFLQTVIQFMPIQQFEASLPHAPLMHQFFKDTFFRGGDHGYHLKHMAFPYSNYHLIPEKYKASEAVLFKHIRDAALYTENSDINFSALRRVPDCYRKGHEHARWEWTIDSSVSCQQTVDLPLTMTASDQYWLLKKFHDFFELVQKVMDKLFLRKVVSHRDLMKMEQDEPLDEDGRAQAFDDHFVKRFTGMSHA